VQNVKENFDTYPGESSGGSSHHSTQGSGSLWSSRQAMSWQGTSSQGTSRQGSRNKGASSQGAGSPVCDRFLFSDMYYRQRNRAITWALRPAWV